MVAVNADELENAMILASGTADFAEAWICRATGQVYVRADGHGDEEAELPDNLEDMELFVPVPDTNKLDLGQRLVFAFVEAEMADEYAFVRQMFRKAGAYRRFGKLVDDRGLRERWHQFRDQRTHAALRTWCEENGFELA